MFPDDPLFELGEDAWRPCEDPGFSDLDHWGETGFSGDEQGLSSLIPVSGQDTTPRPAQARSVLEEPWHQATTKSQSLGGLGAGREQSVLASGGNLGPPPDLSDWYPSFPVSNYLAERVALDQKKQPWTTNSGGPQPHLGMTRGPTLTASNPLLSAIDLPTSDIGVLFKEVSDTTNVSSISATDGAPKKPTERMVVCEDETCRRAFQSRKDLRRHTMTVHDRVYVQCPHCHKLLKGRDDNLKRHVRKYCNKRAM